MAKNKKVRVKELKEIKKVAVNKEVIDNIICKLFLQVHEIRNKEK